MFSTLSETSFAISCRIPIVCKWFESDQKQALPYVCLIQIVVHKCFEFDQENFSFNKGLPFTTSLHF